jgi:hypothetical protein
MWMMMLIHVRVWNLWLGLWVVNGMVVVLRARPVLMRWPIVMMVV